MDIEITDITIAEFVETSPLYVSQKFRNSNARRQGIALHRIEFTCSVCKCSRPFHDPRPRGSGAMGSGPHSAPKKWSTGITELFFCCVTCGESKRIYIHHHVENDIVILTKCGEFPRKKIERNNRLQKFFDKDSELFEKALICLNIGCGIGAFAYLRQIIERNIVGLLDLLKEEIEGDADSKNLIIALDELKKDTPMKTKIDVANNALPYYLKPNGLNPLATLYAILSTGIHGGLSDKECLESSGKLVKCITYLVSELSERKKNRDNFTSDISALGRDM